MGLAPRPCWLAIAERNRRKLSPLDGTLAMTLPNSINPPTRDLLNGYLAGSREDEYRLFELHRERLLRRATNEPRIARLARYTSPEDLVNEVFLKALSSGILKKLEDRGRGSLTRLLSKILDDVAIDIYRWHGAEKRGDGRLPSSYDGHDENARGGQAQCVAVSLDTTPTSKVRAGELLDRCREVLDPYEWEVWHLVEVESFSSVEIAGRLHTTDSAVRGILRRARRKLLARLAKIVSQDPEDVPPKD